MKILITSGGTREPIDQVRFITNFSTGKTGALLTDYFCETGHEVTQFFGEGSMVSRRAATKQSYSSFQDLDQKLRALLKSENFDAIIHLAAVSDYSVSDVEFEGK